MKVIIVRHAESDCNRSKYIEGSGKNGGSLLTEKGKKQAGMLADYLASQLYINCIYTSPATRARDTAAILKNKLNSPVVTVNEFKEIDCGNWEDKSIKYVKETNAE